MKASEILSEALLKEFATSGGTAAGNVATVPGGLGAGFDPNGDKGIYNSAEKKKRKKSNVIRR